MGWISGLVAGVGTAASVRGANRSRKKTNQYYEQMYAPEGVNDFASRLNPYLWDAMRGNKGTTGLQNDMYKIAQGQDISPYLLNQPLNQINQGANRNMAAMTAQLGRSNMSGGLANAYALSNQMGRQNATANLYQNYGQWRETQRRSDLDWLMGQMTNSQNMAIGQRDKIAQTHKFKTNNLEKWGAMLQAFGAASGGGMGGMGGGGGSKSKPSSATGNAGNTQYGQTTQYNPSYMNGQSFGTYNAPPSNYVTMSGTGGGGGGGYNPMGGYGGYTGASGYTGYDPRINMGSGSIYGQRR